MDLLRSRSNLLPVTELIDDIGPPPSSLSDLDVDNAPPDRFGLVWLSCACIGTASLLPYNTMLAGSLYIVHEGTRDHNNFDFYDTLLQYGTIANLIGIIYMIFLGRKTPFWSRMVLFQLFVALTLFFTPFLYHGFPWHVSHEERQWYMIFFAIICGLSAGIFTSSVVSYGALLMKPKYIKITVSTMTFAAIIPDVISLLCTYFWDDTIGWNEYHYFWLNALFPLVASVIFFVGQLTPYARYFMDGYKERTRLRRAKKKYFIQSIKNKYLRQFDSTIQSSHESHDVLIRQHAAQISQLPPVPAEDEEDDAFRLMAGDQDAQDAQNARGVTASNTAHVLSGGGGTSSLGASGSGLDPRNSAGQLLRQLDRSRFSSRGVNLKNESKARIKIKEFLDSTQVSILKVFYKIRLCLLAVCINFGVSYVVYPDILLYYDSGTYGVGLLLAFNTGDFVGRQFVASLPIWWRDEGCRCRLTPNNIWFYSLLRLAFVPVFFMFNNSEYWNEYVVMAVVAVFGVTQGLFATMLFAQYAQLLDEKEQEAGGAMMQLFLVVGLNAGLYVSPEIKSVSL